MYSRRLNSQVLSFGHEGILYKDSFLMYDHQTRSLWVHVTGRCIVGELKGQRLEHFPSVVTSWADWKKRHPETLVLAEKGQPHFLGTFVGMDADKLEHFGLCLVQNGRARGYPLRTLQQQPAINDTFEKREILVVFSPRLRVGNLFDRHVGHRALTFTFVEDDPDSGPLLRDEQTGSRWVGLEGRAIEGPMAGTRLQSLTHHPILLDAFERFYPDGEMY